MPWRVEASLYSFFFFFFSTFELLKAVISELFYHDESLLEPPGALRHHTSRHARKITDPASPEVIRSCPKPKSSPSIKSIRIDLPPSH